MAEVFPLADYPLDPKVQCAILAKYSRSAESAKVLMSTVDEAKAAAFQEKYVVQYSHQSVAELGTIPVCFENISMIASKVIEALPRGAYSEKSTRYQKFSGDTFVKHSGIKPEGHLMVQSLFATYDRMYAPTMALVCKLLGISVEEGSKKAAVKARVFDNLRYLLPSGTSTNVGAVLNLRDISHLIKTLRSHPNEEMNTLGVQMQSVLKDVGGPLIKYTEPNQWFSRSLEPIKLDTLPTHLKSEHGITVKGTLNGSTQGFWKPEFRSYKELDKFMQLRPPHEAVPDCFKQINLTIDLIIDYGAYRDLQRHRRCTQFAELHTNKYGYLIPDDFYHDETLKSDYCYFMDELYALRPTTCTEDEHSFQYILPMGFLHRSRFCMDLKELYYLTELRTKPQGHISYRRAAYLMYQEVENQIPSFLKWCRVINPISIEEHQ